MKMKWMIATVVTMCMLSAGTALAVPILPDGATIAVFGSPYAEGKQNVRAPRGDVSDPVLGGAPRQPGAAFAFRANVTPSNPNGTTRVGYINNTNIGAYFNDLTIEEVDDTLRVTGGKLVMNGLPMFNGLQRDGNARTSFTATITGGTVADDGSLQFREGDVQFAWWSQTGSYGLPGRQNAFSDFSPRNGDIVFQISGINFLDPATYLSTETLFAGISANLSYGNNRFGNEKIFNLSVTAQLTPSLNSAAVPEPSSIALLGAAGLPLIRRRRGLFLSCS